MKQSSISILVGDENLPHVRYTSFLLTNAGYRVVQAYDGPNILRSISQHQPSLVLLDVSVRNASGFDICRQIRQSYKLPVIFLSGHASIEDRVTGLQAGGDDYLIKPFEPAELLARVEAVLRRYNHTVTSKPVRFSHGHISLDVVQHTVSFDDGRLVQLTPIEFRMLYYLIENAGHALTANQIYENVWNDSNTAESNVVALYIRRLRIKIEPQATKFRHIVTVRNFGYKFEP
jgi:DNA-binding response OmpR family regulator